ncbi:MAG TPA: hypothetical protein PKC54_13475 [Ferruginibacter sp.]|nr:hypothetical protein [Ferruginibacter sp.]
MNNNTSPFSKSTPVLIFRAGLLAGVLDILSAFLYYYVKSGKNPLNILNYISKVALGENGFPGSGLQQVSGLLVHFIIAFGWTILFFILYPRLKWLQVNKFFTAIIYGSFVWAMMNVLILPLWNNKVFEFKGETTIVNWLILIIAIGMPLSFIASRNYHQKINRHS